MKLPAEQETIRAQCFNPSGTFIEFSMEDVETSIPARFEKIVKQHPDKIAVKTRDNRDPTYAELNREANRVAHAILTQRGSTAEPVGILFENGIEQIAAMLGVLKAGKFFVLLDPSFPQARVASVLKDAQAELIITDRHNLPFAHELGCKGDRLMEFESIDSSLPSRDPSGAIDPSAIAYLVYTSGSTGKPKGVIQSHRNVLHNIMLRTDATPVHVDDRMASLAAGTGHAVSNTFFALLNGAALLPFDVKKVGVATLAAWLERERITLLWISSPLFRRLCDILTGKEGFSNLRLLRLSSETIHKADIDLYKRYFPSTCPVFVGLASSETGLLRSHFINHETIIADTEVPVGYAVEGKELSLLDDNGKPVGCNKVGQIVVRSRFLSPGYWQRPDLTEAKFQPDPHDPEKRLYYTGDLGLMLADGCLIHKGRKDFRVKIHGYGVEIAEVEKALRRHESIKDAVVVAGQHESGENRLVAYYASSRQPAVTLTQLRSFLSKDLPDYMIPSAFVPLDSMPLLPTGKVDRRALPDPGNERPELETPFVGPRTGIEKELRRIWTEVLGLDLIGVHDNFFDLGGHSLAATRVVSQVIKTFELELPLQSLFQSPTVAEMAAIILAELTSEQRIEFESRLLQNSAIPANNAIPRRETLSPCPLSFGQERLWFLNQLEPECPVYNESSALRLIGLLDVNALEKTFNDIIARHEVLRTTIALVDAKPMQRIAAHRTIELAAIDLSAHFSKDRDIEARRLIDEAVRRPFDLSNDLMLRALLLRLDHEEHILLVVKHHVASDGWSSEIFWREVATLYAAFSSGQTANLPELPVQYADYAAWQRNRLAGEVLERHLSYWQKQLQDIPPAINLPTDRPRPAVQSYRGARQFFALSKELTQKLKALSRSRGVTLYMTLLAAFQTLLFRYTGQDDIVVGSPIANRNRTEIESLIGFFVNTLVLRTDLTNNPIFRELLERVRNVCLSAYSHQNLPFEKIVGELHPDRRLNPNPLFQVTFQLNINSRKPLNFPGLRVEDVELEHPMSKFDLSLSMTDREESMSGRLIYNADLFEASTIERMVGHFQVMLEGIVANPDRPIRELPLLTEAEKHRLLVECNDTKTDYPNNKCIHEHFEAQVEKTPDAIAVVFEDQRLTFRELNNRANQLAHYLNKLGVGPEVLVGICVERSLEMIVGLLGVLKAGRAYLPLDPDDPKERLAFMLEDTQTHVLLTQARVHNNLPEHRAHVICLDREGIEIEQESTENPCRLVPAQSLAYVIYTSGSTGKPKGVAVEHRQLSNYLLSIINRLDLTSQSSFATVSTLAADLGNTVIFASLCTGAALHVLSRDRVTDAEAMADYFSRHSIDCLKIVPSHFATLLSASRREVVLPRKLLILGGEASDIDWVTRLATLAPNCRIVNHYGPTETTIGVMAYAVKKDAFPAGRLHLPLGRPIANTQVYILDQHLNPVPIGVAGEIYIGGQGLARGYLNRPELTSEKFTPNPFSAEPGARLYKTGDRARYLPDGNVEFLGRTDKQIKLRGYRIEPGEIEAGLKQHPDVREAVVLNRSGANGKKQLAAYLVVAPDRAPLIAGKPRYRLPNGAVVVQLNKNETDYIYQEIFERQAYLRHGITIRDGDCIFDVGANIGLFTLFATQIAQRPKVYSFEPNPAVFEILKANAKLTGSDVKLFNCGLADRAGDTTFTFFPGFSLLSGFYADAQAEKQVVKTFMLNQQKAGVADMTELVEQADSILAPSFAAQAFKAELRTLSSIIEQHEIECIDLLKINVEKSELDVLLGIDERDWRKIKQLVLEVDVKENLPTIAALLEKQGYEHVVEQDNRLEGTSLCYVYAIRPAPDRRLIREQSNRPPIQTLPVRDQPLISADELRAFLAAKLPEHMIPSVYLFLDTLPLTANGKIDRQGLATLSQKEIDPQERFEAPRTPMEEMLAQIWADVLTVERIGIHDNFFDLGGHSLLATQVVSRMRRALQVEIPLRALFESPTVASLADRIGEIQQKEQGLQALPLLAVSRDKDLPLSFAQQRLWFLDQLVPGSTAYNVPSAVRIRGPLDVTALERSLNEIVTRHEILRTTFSTVEGEAVQIISPPLSHSLPVVDLSGQAGTGREEEAQRLAREEARRPFDLAREPLVRVTLLRLDEEDHVLLLSLHHIVSDGWSMKVLYRELSVLYEAFSQNNPSPLTDLPIQYADFGLWQRQWLQGEILKTQLAYWKKQLGDVALLQLTTDRPRPALPSHQGARESIKLSKELTQKLRALSRSHDVTLYMTLLAAFQTLLFRYTEQDDIAVGSPIAGRTREETEGLIGFFVNTLVLRSDLSGNPPFRELLARVRETALGAYAHQDLPFEKLVEELQPERNIGHSPLFQVMFVLQNPLASAPIREFAGLKLRLFRVESEPAQFDVMLTMREGAGGLRGSLLYNTDLFDEATIKKMLGHFQTLLEGIVANPERRISELSLLTDSERHQLLVEWNDTKRDYPADKCVHQLFEQQVERTPDALAVVFEDHQPLTYRELNQRANQLAHYLRQQGVQPDTLVALCLERSIEMVIGILGVLKAGGAYLPIDPNLPAERRQFEIQDTQARVILTQDKHRLQFEDVSSHIVCLDSEWHKLLEQSRENPQHQVVGRDAAYVIYTSGSTGTPKGVINVHSGLLNRLQWMQQTYRLTPADRVLQKTPFSFDISVWEFLWPLISGACLVVARPDGHRDSAYLVQLIKSQQITTLHFVPSMLEVFLQDSGVDGCNSLRQVICSGEALSYELQQRFFERSAAALHNLYGPTEASIDVTAWQCRRESALTVVPIGRPIANTQIYLLDRRLQPVPVGVAAELHIGGVGLARGYLNRSELTQERFIANPFSNDPESRLYKTGDLARYLPDGNIQFLGRLDNQIKLRGYRIELGEIESVLAQHPDIQQAVVLTREDKPGDRRLVAYCVATANSNALPRDLRSYLQHKLPDYMIPSAFVLLDSLPLTPNGKLDRKSLPAPGHDRPEPDDGFAAPRTPLEESLANIWAEVLKLDKVGIHDNFFHLGGHSLLATQVVSRMRNAFSIEVRLRQMFESPTIAEMATLITENQVKRDEMVKEYIEDQEGEQIIDNGRLPIDSL